MERSDITCPKCGEHTKNLIRHFIGRHAEYNVSNKADILELFPDYNGMFHIDSRSPGEYICPVCGRKFNFKNGLQMHIKSTHPDEYEKYKSTDKRKCAYLRCPICNEMKSDMKQHINVGHKQDWINFCQQYNWDSKLTKYITDEYRKNLSVNKTKFYRETDRGYELRKSQSNKWKQRENNPIYDKKCLEKSIHSRTIHGKIPERNGRGITIHYKGIRFRSYNEFVFYILCKKYNIRIEYEPTRYCIRYFNDQRQFFSTYLPDFYIENIGLIELKTNKGDKERCLKRYNKYREAQDIYKNLNIPYHICTLNEAMDMVGVSKMPGFEIRDFAKNEILNNLDNVHIWCYNNSRIIRNIFGDDFNEINNNLTLYEK